MRSVGTGSKPVFYRGPAKGGSYSYVGTGIKPALQLGTRQYGWLPIAKSDVLFEDFYRPYEALFFDPF